MPLARVSFKAAVVVVCFVPALLATSTTSLAHCDTMGGPVVREGNVALEKGDVTPLLKWIGPAQEAELKAAFARTTGVRAKGAAEKDLADRYFLETLVRLHRASEGMPYTGLKTEPVEPLVEVADRALADGSVDALIKLLNVQVAAAVRERFGRALEAKKGTTVAAGREYVEAYVAYVHAVEGIKNAIGGSQRHALEVDERESHAVHEHGLH